MKFTRCGLDIAKQVFQVHGVNEHGVVQGRKTLPLPSMHVLHGRSSPMGPSIDPRVRRPPWPDVDQAPLTRSRH